MADQPASPVTPYLMVRGASRAVDFYRQAFGAEEIERYPDPNSDRLGHVTLKINGGVLYLSDEFPEVKHVKTRSPEALGGTTASIVLNVSDADDCYERAIKAGAEIVRPISNQFYGRNASIRDPFGHIWGILGPAKEGSA
jgi:PhnB protein